MSRLFLFVASLCFTGCNSSFFDPNTKSIALSAAKLTATFVLRAGDSWAKYERQDGDVEWKDVVADVYMTLREYHKINKKEAELLDHEVSEVLKELARERKLENGKKQ